MAYVYAPDRKAKRPMAHLAGFTGVLQVDGYGGYWPLAEKGQVQLAFCWAHVRRRFYELAAAGLAPIASEALERIKVLYAIQPEIRGLEADARNGPAPGEIPAGGSRAGALAACQAHHHQPQDQARRGHPLRALALERPHPIPRRRPYRARQQHRRALHPAPAAKLNDIDPQAHITSVIARIVDGHTQSQIDQLMPWNYPPDRL